jgi:hypothetical protein
MLMSLRHAANQTRARRGTASPPFASRLILVGGIAAGTFAAATISKAAAQQPPLSATVQLAPTQPATSEPALIQAAPIQAPPIPPAPADTAPLQAGPSRDAPALPPQTGPSLASPSLPGAPPDKRGFLNDISRWWDQSIADFNAKLKEQQSKLDDLNKQSNAAAKDAADATQQAMKSAADAVARMSKPASVIEIQQVCPAAGNGAPDCEAAALKACKVKGFAGGQPLDIRTAEKCNASLWVSGQPPQTPVECPVETVLLRAACQ